MQAKPIEPGRSAPGFSLRDQSGRPRTLAEFRGRPLVIFFYPEDGTPTCTAEACGFRDALGELRRAGAEVVGIGPDDTESHARFRGSLGLGFDLLADQPGVDGVPRVCLKYGVWREKILYGRRYSGLIRTTYLIDAKGIVARRWDHVRVKAHATAVLAALAELQECPDSPRSGRVRRPKSGRTRVRS